MIKKILTLVHVVQNMGWRYTAFRTAYEIKLKSGLLKKEFPARFADIDLPTVAEWRTNKPTYLIDAKEHILIPKVQSQPLKEAGENILAGQIKYYNHKFKDIGQDYDWLTNPFTGKKFPLTHWTEIPDYSQESGDIKDVWEKSRFSYLLTILRYDYHFDIDCARFLFEEMENWITANPLNTGPNYRCSQEISIRVFNWLFALYYYQNSPLLTEERFKLILTSIYGQLQHVFANINFSRIAVRNNHAITETLCLYVAGLLFPFMPEAAVWKSKGKAWFEEEINYQIYDDGTFLQFSMNYHRVAVQLFNLAFAVAKRNDEQFDASVYDRADKSLQFLVACMEPSSGNLPNYGANDGALFFPLTDAVYRDYRPQLNTLSVLLHGVNLFNDAVIQEDKWWHSETVNAFDSSSVERTGLFRFESGGYYIIKEKRSLTFIRCGNHKDRPSQADNLHVDIWIDGINVLRDAGSYKYNTTPENIKFFMGTQSHNTVMLNSYDQMEKASRFVWLNWSSAKSATLTEMDDRFVFEGEIRAFNQVAKNQFHRRKLTKYKNQLTWEIEDETGPVIDLAMKQIWNPGDDRITFVPTSKDILKTTETASYSSYYGHKEISEQVIFSTRSGKISTLIQWKDQKI